MDNKDVVRAVVERCFNAGDLEAAKRLVDDAVNDHAIPIGLPNGMDGFRGYVTSLRRAMPDLRWTIAEIVAEGDLVCFHGEVSGTHRGDFNGLPASGLRLRVSTVDMVRVKNGKCVEHWGGLDMGALLQQIGAMPMPAPAI